jgi:hypothetical protein
MKKLSEVKVKSLFKELGALNIPSKEFNGEGNISLAVFSVDCEVDTIAPKLADGSPMLMGNNVPLVMVCVKGSIKGSEKSVVFVDDAALLQLQRAQKAAQASGASVFTYPVLQTEVAKTRADGTTSKSVRVSGLTVAGIKAAADMLAKDKDEQNQKDAKEVLAALPALDKVAAKKPTTTTNKPAKNAPVVEETPAAVVVEADEE